MIRTYGCRSDKRNGAAFQQGIIASGPGANQKRVGIANCLPVNQMPGNARYAGKTFRYAFQERDLIICYNIWYFLHG